MPIFTRTNPESIIRDRAAFAAGFRPCQEVSLWTCCCLKARGCCPGLVGGFLGGCTVSAKSSSTQTSGWLFGGVIISRLVNSFCTWTHSVHDNDNTICFLCRRRASPLGVDVFSECEMHRYCTQFFTSSKTLPCQCKENPVLFPVVAHCYSSPTFSSGQVLVETIQALSSLRVRIADWSAVLTGPFMQCNFGAANIVPRSHSLERNCLQERFDLDESEPMIFAP